MKLFLDTADTQVIKEWKNSGLIDGVTTNPTNLSKEGGNPTHKIEEICELLPDGEISVEVTQKKPDAVYKQAKELYELSNNIIIKIPCHREYYAVINKLVSEGVPLNITLVFTLIQGSLMSKLGVRYISPFVGRWDDIDVEGFTLLHKMRKAADRYNFRTSILAASLRHVRHVHHALVAGVDVITVPASLLEKMVSHPLTDIGIEKFDTDWLKLNISKFP